MPRCSCWDRDKGIDPALPDLQRSIDRKGKEGGSWHDLGDRGCWIGIEKGVHVITDLGFDPDSDIVSRFSVWIVEDGVAVRVIENSNELDALKEAYRCNSVVKLPGGSNA